MLADELIKGFSLAGKAKKGRTAENIFVGVLGKQLK